MKSNLMPAASEKSSSASGGVTSPSKETYTLDDGTMRKAYEDTELLKAIVVPLEEQVTFDGGGGGLW
jgi:hypothetical protein